MISFIKGTAEIILSDSIILYNNGIGYKIKMSPNTLSSIEINKEIKIYTHMNVREDDISLFGFKTLEEINMFNLLISVSGIGPKVALGTLGCLSPQELILGIISDDYTLLSKAPGVGKKTAQRVILELKDKMKSNESYFSENNNDINTDLTNHTNKQDAIDALIALGYSRAESIQTVMNVSDESMTVEKIIKLSLKKFIKV